MSLVETRLTHDDDDLMSVVHAPFAPGDVLRGDPIQAEVSRTLDGTRHRSVVAVWRLSPVAVELVEAGTAPSLTVGTAVAVVLRLGRQHIACAGTVVHTGHHASGRVLTGVRWDPASTPALECGTRRRWQRWACGSEFLPTGVAANPARYDDLLHFRVRELSRAGMQAVTSLRNRFLVPGVHLDASVDFPAVGRARMRLRICHAQVTTEHGKQYLLLGLEHLDPDAAALGLVAQYVFQFGPRVSIEELRASDLHVRSCARAVDFSFVRTPEEYRQVLALRHLAYAGAGKIREGATAEDTADAFDARARILVGRHRGEVVCSMRLVFHDRSDTCEHEQYTELPDDFPRLDDLIEITRVCTHPAYRGSDLVLTLFKHALVTCAQSGRRWVIGSATPKLLPLYERIGFQLSPIRYRHEALGGEEHVLFVGDVHGALSGAGVGPFVWNAMYADVCESLDVSGIVTASAVVRTRLALYRLCRPLHHLLARRMSRRQAARASRAS